jgi:hypothetical protein
VPLGSGELKTRGTSMSALKWLLMLVGVVLYGSAGALVAYDVYLAEQLCRLVTWGKTNKSAKEINAYAPRSSMRKGLTWRPNSLGSAGQGFR